MVGRQQRKLLELVEGLTRIQGGRGAVQTPGGSFLDPAIADMRIGQTTSGGITARSGGTLGYGTVDDTPITYASPTSATIATASTSFTAFNYSGTAIAGNKYVVCRLLWGIWLVISAEC